MIKRNLLKFGVVVMVSACLVGCGSKAEESKPVETTGVVAEVETTAPEIETTTPVEVETTEEVTTESPTEAPTEAPTEKPTEAPTKKPVETQEPTEAPTTKPVEKPTQKSTEAPKSEDSGFNPPTEAPIDDAFIREYALSIANEGKELNSCTFYNTGSIQVVEAVYCYGYNTKEEAKEMVYSLGINWKEKARDAAFARFGTDNGHTAESVRMHLTRWQYAEDEVEYAVSEWSKNPPAQPLYPAYEDAYEWLKTRDLATTDSERRGTLYDKGYTDDEINYAIEKMKQ